MIILDFKSFLKKKKILLFDGSMGAQLMMRGLESGKLPDLWNIEKPEVIFDLFNLYYNAGSDLVQTATFQANGLALQKMNLQDQLKIINSRSGELLDKACPPNKFKVADIGPSAEFLPPVGTTTVKEMENGFYNQAKVLNEYIDAWHLETFSDIKEIKFAIRAVRKISDKPIIASMTYKETPKGFYTVMGNSISHCIEELMSQSIEVIGANCTLGSKDFIKLVKEMRRIIPEFPLSIKPNAGQPELQKGKTVYKQPAEEFVEHFREILEYNVQIIGGCCGTGPEHIRLLRSLIDSM